jgi:hypothetical protein
VRLASIKPGDRIEANVRGLVFTAPVREVHRGEVQIDPPKGVSYFRLTARQVRRRLAA